MLCCGYYFFLRFSPRHLVSDTISIYNIYICIGVAMLPLNYKKWVEKFVD